MNEPHSTADSASLADVLELDTGIADPECAARNLSSSLSEESSVSRPAGYKFAVAALVLDTDADMAGTRLDIVDGDKSESEASSVDEINAVDCDGVEELFVDPIIPRDVKDRPVVHAPIPADERVTQRPSAYLKPLHWTQKRQVLPKRTQVIRTRIRKRTTPRSISKPLYHCVELVDGSVRKKSRGKLHRKSTISHTKGLGNINFNRSQTWTEQAQHPTRPSRRYTKQL